MSAVSRHGTTLRVALGVAALWILGGASFVVGEASPLRQTAPSLGAASSFAVLGGSAVTNIGATTVGADLGVSPGSAATGFPPGTVVGGSIHAADALAALAQSDTTTAYNGLAGQPCTANLTGQDLGGKTLVAGVYCFPSTSAQLTGALTLNAQGNANAVFIFKIGSTLTTASGSSVQVINSGSPCTVFWQVGSSATIGTTTTFGGNILALTSITLNTGARVSGRALARNGAVTMDTNSVGSAGCALGAATPTPTPTASASPTPTATAVATATASAPATDSATATSSPIDTAASSPSSSSSAPRPAPTAVLTPSVAPTSTATLATTPATVSVAASAVTSPTANLVTTQPPAPPPVAVPAPIGAVDAAASSALPTAEQPAADMTPAEQPAADTPSAEQPQVTMPAAETPAAPTRRVPTALPRTGEGFFNLGLWALLLGSLATALGLMLRRAAKAW